jgi:thioredoxin reductase
LAQEVMKVVDIPVIAANMIRSPEQAEKQLQDGIQDFVSLGRPLIADPHWVEKVMNGEEKLIKRCVCCLYCFESMMHNAYKYTHGNCSVNPLVGSEGETFNNNGNGRRVAIVGAGVAGLTAAELLAKRGFNVSIYEKAAEVGGQINLAKMPPNKEKIAWCVQDLKANVQNLGVTIKYNTTVDKDLLDEIKPEIVICATGANAVSPKAFSGDNICTVTQILNGEVRLENRRVAVIGSGMTGLETSELLVKQGNRVTIIEMANEIAPGAWFQQVDDVMPKLKAANTVFMPSHKLLEIHNDCVIIENTKTKSKVNVEVDNVVLSLGCKPDNDLYNQIKNSDSYKVYNIGDSVKVGRIANATESAYQVVKSIE